MILVDTSVWIDHLHAPDQQLTQALGRGEVARHPAVLSALDGLPSVTVARDQDVRDLVERRRLFGRGLSWVDVHLLASTVITPGCRLWTRDKRLALTAAEVGAAG